jgi:hypothetical protein
MNASDSLRVLVAGEMRMFALSLRLPNGSARAASIDPDAGRVQETRFAPARCGRRHHLLRPRTKEELMFGTRIVATAILLVSCGAALGAGPELYPGAKTERWVKRCLAAGKKVPIAADKIYVTDYYVTPDPFDRVVEFYKKFGPERPVPSDNLQKLPNGATAQMARFFPTGPVSGTLLTVQRPALCGSDMKEVHDVTLIQVMHKNKNKNKKR